MRGFISLATGAALALLVVSAAAQTPAPAVRAQSQAIDAGVRKGGLEQASPAVAPKMDQAASDQPAPKAKKKKAKKPKTTM